MGLFTIKVKAKDSNELDRKIKDNESRGFKLDCIHETGSERPVYIGNEYRGLKNYNSLVAIMSRPQLPKYERESG